MINKRSGLLWFYVFALLFLFLPICFILLTVLQYTHGIFIYPFDDTFIHLTIADNILKGSWGVNDKEFNSASSSILYSLILAVFRLFSKSSLVPFIVNCLAGVAIIAALYFWLRKHLPNYFGQTALFLLVIFFTPLPLVIISGMEHTLQCLFSFLFVFYFSDWLESCSYSQKRPLPAKILLFAVLISTIRYEGLFLIAIAALLLLVYKRVRESIILISVSLAPLLIFGLISVSKGNYFLPNSVLIKSGTFNYSSPLSTVYNVFFERLVYARNGMPSLATQRLLIILPLLYLAFKKYLKPSYFFILIFLFGATILQLSFASTGYLYRYESYLFFCSTIILCVIFYQHGKHLLAQLNSNVAKISVLILAFFLVFPPVLRGIAALSKTSQACINIYDQQYQMAMFVKKNYNESVIALNDIGAVGYFTDAKIIDLWGLASKEVAKSKKQQYWTPDFLDSLCRAEKVDFTIIYDSWFSDSLTKRWNNLATWQIRNNVICGDSVVSFYCLDTLRKSNLQQKLKIFQPLLPSSILVKYY